MSDLEEENRHHSDCLNTAEWSEDQIGILLDCEAERLGQARRLYDTIQIPGELNTRVRAAIESNRRHRKSYFLRLIIAGATAVIGACCIVFHTGLLSKQQTEFRNPSRNVTAYPETKESVNVLQTTVETEEETESESETETETAFDKRTETVKDCSTESKNQEN